MCFTLYCIALNNVTHLKKLLLIFRINNNDVVCVCLVRTATARGKAELADMAADHAREDFEIAIATAKQFAPDFTQPGNALTFLCEHKCSNFICKKALLPF